MTAPGPLTLEDLERLEAVARRARDVDQRPWRQVREHDLWTAVYSGHAPGRMVVDCATKEDGALIAALDPATVLRLTAALRSVMAERDRARMVMAAEKSAKVAAFERLANARKAWQRFVRHGLWSAQVHSPDCAYHKAKSPTPYSHPCDCGLIAIGEALEEADL